MKRYYDKYDEIIKKINDSDSNHKRQDIIIYLWYDAALDIPIYDIDDYYIKFILN